MLAPWNKSYDQLGSILKSRDITLPTKFHLVKALVFSSSDVWMWQLDYKESGVSKNWCFWTVVLEKTLESDLDFKEIKLANPKRYQSWIFIGRTGAEMETPILWPPDEKNWLIGIVLMLGKVEGRRRRGWPRMRWLDGITNLMDELERVLENWWWTEKPGLVQSLRSQRVRHDWATELNWFAKELI